MTSTPLPEQGGFDERLDRILDFIENYGVSASTEGFDKTASRAEAENAIRTLVLEEICEDYPKDWSYDDPEFVLYANIEHDRQRKKLGGQ